MAAPKTTVATHLEQQFLEVAYAMKEAENADLQQATPTLDGTRGSISPNFTGDTVTIEWTLPITTSADPDGGISFDATEVLP